MKLERIPAGVFYLLLFVMLLGLLSLASLVLFGPKPGIVKNVDDVLGINQDPTVVAEAMTYQEAIAYPGPVATKEPGPGTPTPATLEQVRNALKWGHAGNNLALYVLQDGETIYVVFEPMYEPYGGFMTPEHAKSAVWAILDAVSTVSGEYDYLVIYPGYRGYDTAGKSSASAYEKFRVVYKQEVVRQRPWEKNGDVYIYALRKTLPPGFDITEPAP